jgi:hypothetical protein
MSAITSVVIEVIPLGSGSGLVRLNSIVSGGVGPLTYQWKKDGLIFSTAAFIASAAVLHTYELTVTDSTPSSATDTLYIPDVTRVYISAIVETTCGSSTGDITITATGGINQITGDPYEYSIDGGTTWVSSNVFTGVAAGTYSVLARCGAEVAPTVIIPDSGFDSPGLWTIINNSNPISTIPAVIAITGSEVNITTNSGPFVYTDFRLRITADWSPFSNGYTGATLNYSIETGSWGSSSGSIVIVDGLGLTAIVLVSNPAANTTYTGTISLADGVPTFPFQLFIISYAGISQNIVLKNATFAVTGITESFYISSPLLIDVVAPGLTVNVNTSTCVMRATATVTGGDEPYEYSIDNTTWQSSNVFAGLPIGTYTIYARDINGCTGQSLPFIINTPIPNTVPMIYRYTGKSWFHEHPYIDPQIQRGIDQVDAFIFPGDEITLYHKVCLPCDAVVANINDVNIISAKCSLVAVKPQVFSEEFSDVFKSTRLFELDSVTTLFNGVNAPYLPFGSDGVARSLQVNQDRVFKLPPADFHRQIKYFTDHVNSTQEWNYWFYFPILFRWEYWQSLLTVHNDFFDLVQPLNGKNQFWERFFVDGVWKLQSRLDLNCLINGIPTVIRCSLDIAKEPEDVNDYNSNSDWINKSIKTCKIGGTPTNTPCVIYANEDTDVFGYFEKVSGWSPDEQANMSAIMWVEPFEGGGITQRTRGSSIYEVQSESVFKGLSLSLTDDNGIGVTDENGNYIIVDAAGKGAILYFDGINPALLRVFSIIDKNKLAAIYPNATRFTLYCRLYNGLTPISAPIKGEEIKQDSVLVNNAQGSTTCLQRQPLCPYDLKVFANLNNNLYLENDKSDFLYYGDPLVSNIQFTLQKSADSCDDNAWSDVAVISNSSYGQFFEFGKSLDFLNNYFTDEFNKKYTGLMLSWKSVLTAFGTGFYRMKITYTDTNAVDTVGYDSRKFCLRNYNCNLVDKTVRIETVNIGLRGSLSDQLNYTDYSTGWNGQIRLEGLLRYRESNYNSEYSVYGTGQFNVKKPYIDEQNPKFTLSLKQIPGWMQWYASTNILQADSIIVTDYNLANDRELTRIPLIKDGAFSPIDNKLANPHSSVTIPMAYAKDNLRLQNS